MFTDGSGGAGIVGVVMILMPTILQGNNGNPEFADANLGSPPRRLSKSIVFLI